jgi:hypothetical protein
MMDIEDLSKSQLLLLTILVNFVVAIATGVLTVSLLDEAPTSVTQTVNRIVDHTIETVSTQVPVASEGDGGPTTEELLTSAIAGNAARRVLIYRAGTDGPVAAGVYLASKRAVLTVSNELPGHVRLVFADGSTVEADRIAEDGPVKAYRPAEGVALPGAPAARFAEAGSVKAGQTAIALTPDGSAVTGIISKVEEGSLSANLPGVLMGSAAVGLSGEIIGLSSGGSTYINGSRIEALAEALP